MHLVDRGFTMVGLLVCLVGCGAPGSKEGRLILTNSTMVPAPEAKSPKFSPLAQPAKQVVSNEIVYPAPKVSEISYEAARLITDTKMLPHTDDTRYLEEVLIHWLSERPFERLCVAYSELDHARESYTGEDIAFSGNRGAALPVEPFGNWVRMSPPEANALSRRRCEAIPFVKIIPNEISYFKDGKKFASVGCMNGISRAGLIAHPYPEGFRSFLAFRESDGSIHILRGHREYMDDYAIEYRMKDRIKRRHLYCDPEPTKP